MAYGKSKKPAGQRHMNKGAGNTGHSGTMGRGGGSAPPARGTMGAGRKGGYGSKGTMGSKH